MAEAWKPGMGVCITELDTNMFPIQVGHKADVRRALEGEPWSYNNNIMLLERVFPEEEPRHKVVNSISLRIQAYEIPIGCMSESIA